MPCDRWGREAAGCRSAESKRTAAKPASIYSLPDLNWHTLKGLSGTQKTRKYGGFGPLPSFHCRRSHRCREMLSSGICGGYRCCACRRTLVRLTVGARFPQSQVSGNGWAPIHQAGTACPIETCIRSGGVSNRDHNRGGGLLALPCRPGVSIVDGPTRTSGR